VARPVLLTSLVACCLALVAAEASFAADARAEDRRVAQLRAEAVALRSIEPGDEDFSDLAPLRTILAKKRVVILGEAGHGDGAQLEQAARRAESRADAIDPEDK
jgi:hypothetical protein